MLSAIPAVAFFGIGFGAAAIGAGVSPEAALAMSTFVFAGASQYAALELWVDPLPLGALLIMTLAVNARHLVLGATLHSFLEGERHLRKLAILALLSDANWAATQQARDRGEKDLAHLLGGGLLLWCIWLASTWFGAWMGDALGDLRKFGIDTIMPAFFLCSLIALRRSRADIFPWLAATLATGLATFALAVHWAILLGTALGLAAGAVRDGE